MSFSNNFLPSSQIVTNITNSNPGVVTTSAPNGYSSNLFVRIVCPESIGMNQVLNNLYKITVINSSNFAINVNTLGFDVFNLPSSTQSCQVIPVGNESPGLLQPEQNAGNIIPET